MVLKKPEVFQFMNSTHVYGKNVRRHVNVNVLDNFENLCYIYKVCIDV